MYYNVIMKLLYQKKLFSKNLKQTIISLLFVICTIGVIYSITSIIYWKIDSDKTKNQIEALINLAFSDKGVDFDKLKKINPDTVGWIKIEGTEINYPFIQSKDNTYYLNHSFDKSPNRAGWIFLDYRIDISLANKNTIIYGHDRKDKTMFGSLENAIAEKWHLNTNKHIVKLYTEKENSLWQIFSAYHIKTTNDYLQTNFSTNKDYQKILDLLLSRSINKFGVEVTTNDRILTLSTCYNKNEKTVVHAKLIKIESVK